MSREHSRIETQKRIQELRESLNTLENRLIHLESEEQEQHKQIEHLDEYIDAVSTKFSSLKTFWSALRQEWHKPKA